jgi:hypothetical protein
MPVSTAIWFRTKFIDLQRSELQVLISPFLSMSKMAQVITIAICNWEMILGILVGTTSHPENCCYVFVSLELSFISMHVT